MKYSILLLSLAAIILQGCMYDATETKVNNEIDAGLRQIIKTKNDSLLNALSDSDNKALKALGTEDFVKHLQSRIENVVWAFRRGTLDTKYTVYTDYYNKHEKAPNNTKLESGEGNYIFMYGNTTKETYVSLLKTSYADISDYLVTTIYELHNGKWKLNYVHIDALGQYGKNAQEYYEIAKQKAEKGFFIDAAFNIDMAESFIKPSADMLRYNNEADILKYQKEWHNEVNRNYRFPDTLHTISSKPVIMDLKPVNNKQGMYPMFSYLTQVPIQDTTVLKMELEDIKATVKKSYTGLDFSAKNIYYRAYNNNNYNKYHEFKEVNAK